MTSRIAQPSSFTPFEMQMRRVRETCLSNLGDDLSTCDVLTREHMVGAAMRVERGRSVSMEHDDHVAHARDAVVAIHDEPTARGDDRIAFCCADVDPVVTSMHEARIARVSESTPRMPRGNGECQSLCGVEITNGHQPLLEWSLMHDRHRRGAKTEAQMSRERSRGPHGRRHETLALAMQTIAAAGTTLTRHPHALPRRLQRKTIRITREPTLGDALRQHDAPDAIDGLGFRSGSA